MLHCHLLLLISVGFKGGFSLHIWKTLSTGDLQSQFKQQLHITFFICLSAYNIFLNDPESMLRLEDLCVSLSLSYHQDKFHLEWPPSWAYLLWWVNQPFRSIFFCHGCYPPRVYYCLLFVSQQQILRCRFRGQRSCWLYLSLWLEG